MYAGERNLPCVIAKQKQKKMEKMFYQKPESKEIELLIKNRILVGSDGEEPTIIPGSGDTGDLG
jgi:hypothetical protein